MNAIIIDRRITKKEEIIILDKIKDNNTKLFSLINAPENLKEFISNPIELSPEEKKKINYDVFNKILDFGELKINNRTITSLLTLENASIWHYHKFRTYFYLRNTVFKIKELQKYAEIFSNIKYYGNIPEFDLQKNIVVYNSSPLTKNKISISVLIKYSIFFILRLILSVFDSQKVKNKKHIIIDSSLKQKILNINTLKEKFGNYYIEYLLDKITNDFIILDDVSIPKFNDVSFKIDFKLLKFRRNRILSERIMFKGLLSGGIRRALVQQEKTLKESYEIIKDSGLSSVDILIINHIISLHKTSKLFIFKYLCYKYFFQNKLFKTLTSVDENSPKIKSIFDAAKFNNIKTIGIQHGTIHELHPAYIFTKKDKERGLMPDYTMVWGEFWKRLLVNKGNYPEDSLVVTGQIRTDIIPQLKNSKKNNITGIPNDKKIIVFASQPQRDEKLRKQAAFDVFSSVSKLPGVFLVIKLHPAEFNDFDYYRRIASEAECNNFTIVYNIDLYNLISISEIIITCFSTVGAETVYFNKPLVILDHLKQDIQNYKKEGIAFQATDKKTLKDIITNILSGNLKIDKKAYTDYILKYAHKIDGKVTQRIINFIYGI